MTTKKDKTVLFASLIAAMILPLSMMDFADAKSNSNSDSYDKLSSQIDTDVEKFVKSSEKFSADAKKLAKLNEKFAKKSRVNIQI